MGFGFVIIKKGSTYFAILMYIEWNFDYDKNSTIFRLTANQNFARDKLW